MDYQQVFEISASGMKVQKTRLEVAAYNLANMQSVQTADGVRFQPLTTISHASGVASSAAFESALAGAGLGARAQVVPVATAPRLVYEPGHPNADARGMVAYPGVDHLTQMTTITEALRSYEANLAALQAAKSMATRALEIGGGQ